jgi:hypothetical protein
MQFFPRPACDNSLKVPLARIFCILLGGYIPLVYLLSISRMNFSYSESASLALILPDPQSPFPRDCHFPEFIVLDPVIVYQEISPELYQLTITMKLLNDLVIILAFL